jgi:hypothetical protein
MEYALPAIEATRRIRVTCETVYGSTSPALYLLFLTGDRVCLHIVLSKRLRSGLLPSMWPHVVALRAINQHNNLHWICKTTTISPVAGKRIRKHEACDGHDSLDIFRVGRYWSTRGSFVYYLVPYAILSGAT